MLIRAGKKVTNFYFFEKRISPSFSSLNFQLKWYFWYVPGFDGFLWATRQHRPRFLLRKIFYFRTHSRNRNFVQHFEGDASGIFLDSCSPENFLQNSKASIFVQNVHFQTLKSKLSKLKNRWKRSVLQNPTFHHFLFVECKNCDRHRILDTFSDKIAPQKYPGLSIQFCLWPSKEQVASRRLRVVPQCRCLRRTMSRDVFGKKVRFTSPLFWAIQRIR